MRNNKTSKMMISAMLCALAIIIPMFSPVKIIIEPASFTLASHVAIMIAMFLSPEIGAVVNVGATLGFFLGGFPPVVVARAASQLIFVVIGGYIIKKNPDILDSTKKMIPFMLGISLIHAAAEVIVVLPFYLNGAGNDLFYSVFILVGVGTLIHSCVDFMISKAVWDVVARRIDLTIYRTKQA